jgi:hypothetical protein
MLSSIFHLAAISPTRRRAFRSLALAHIGIYVFLFIGMASSSDWAGRLGLGNALLIAGIVEGALLIGWRLTQLPKSLALEFLLVTQLQPSRFLLAEAVVGIWRLLLVTALGAPFLVGLWTVGSLDALDVAVLLAMPVAWGLLTGLGLTAWAYEPVEVRLWGERFMLVGVLVYLVVGVLVGENLPRWLHLFPRFFSEWMLSSLLAFHEYNPFGAMRSAMLESSSAVWGRVLFVTTLGFVLAGLCLYRAMIRLLAHFHDLHYRPALLHDDRPRPRIGNRPLAWWAVKRVGNYSGRINLWLAGGFTLAYSAYLLAGPAWPNWLGKNVFLTFESMGGIPMLTTALVLLAAVPAAFQYGLWDNNVQDRCRRLELLLLTELDGRAYWHAAFAAAWHRGRGYFALAGLLWLMGWWTGVFTLGQALAAASAGVVLWGLYFALGFWSFSSGVQANTLGLTLTLLTPLATFVAFRLGFPMIATALPPGSLYFVNGASPLWPVGPLAAGVGALIVARLSLTKCDASLRRWYDRNHGVKVIE